MDLSSIEQIIRTQVPNAPDSDVELYLDSVQRDMKFGGDYSDMSEDDIVEDFEFYIQSRMDEAQKPSMKMKKSELKEMIKAAFLSEADFTNAQDDDAAPAIAGMYDPVFEGADSAIAKLADKVEDLPIVDKLADKIQANPKAMDALNKLAAVYGGSVNEDFGGIDLSTIIKKSQAFADKVNEGDASFTASGVLGGPLLMGLLGLIPGAMDAVVQTVNSAVGMAGDGAYEPAFLLSVAGGVLIGAIIDKIKNSLSEGEDEEESLDDILARVMGTKADPYMAEDLNEAEEEEEEEVDIDVKDTDLSSDDEEVESANDSIVVDKKIVSLSSLPQETRKILDTLETLRAQAEEFGDQKFITQVGNTITFFTRDFVVAGDAPNPAGIEESAFPMWNKIK